FVFAGYGISDSLYDDYKDLDVKGKVAVIFLGEPKSAGKYLVTGNDKYSKYTRPGIVTKTKIAREKGAVAVLIINPTTEFINSTTASSNSKSDVSYPNKSTTEGLNY